jgi:hypothetical protein
MVNLEKLEGWSGDVDELARQACTILAARGLADSTTEPNVRLIRDYAQRGIISRAERQGKEAIYGYRQLLELVAALSLVADGWPLAKIAEQFAVTGEADLRSLVTGPRASFTPAQQVIRRLRAEAPPSTGARSPSTESFRKRAAQMSSMQAELREALRRLGLPQDAPAVEQLTLIAVAPWCQLLMESKRVERLTIEEAETIGRAVTAALLTMNRRK